MKKIMGNMRSYFISENVLFQKKKC